MKANQPLSASERFSKQSAKVAIEKIYKSSPISFNQDNLDLLRIGMNAVFAADDIIIRIHSPALSEEFIQDQIDFALFLIKEDVLTPRPLYPSPFKSGRYLFSFWERIRNEKEVNPISMGGAVKVFHEKVKSFSRENLYFFDYFKKMEFRLEGLEKSGWVEIKDLDLFEKFLAGEKDKWDRSRQKLDVQTIHADITKSNVIENNNGVYLFDFDWVAYGSLEADLSKLSRERFGEGDLLKEGFFQGYGIDPEQYPRIAVLENLQLFSATALLAVQEKTDQRKAEFDKRLQYWLGGQDNNAPFWEDI